MKSRITIVQAMEDPKLFRRWFGDQESWAPWKVFLRVLFGLPLRAEDLDLYRRSTGLDAVPAERIEEGWVVVGRRAGKSLILALIGVFLAVFVDWSAHLVPGELALIRILAADRKQARAIYGYARAMLERVPLLAGVLESSTDDEIALSNGITIEIGTASWRGTRGATLIAALCDETGVWWTGDVSNPDSEILAALRPGLATTGGMLLCAGSPYAKKGEMWEAVKRYFAKAGPVLVWKTDTRTMHPSLPRRIVDAAYERDAAVAASEYGRDGEIVFRSDLETFIAKEVVEAAVSPGRFELPRLPGVRYFGFADAAGGSGSDSFASCVAHRDRATKGIVVDCVRETRPPFSPEQTVADHAGMFRAYGVREIEADRWGGEFPPEQFQKHGITCRVSERVKSDIYRDALPLLNSGMVELLDNERLVAQLCGLERRVARGGRDSIDHAAGGHDDIANACLGAVVRAAAERGPMKISDRLLAAAAEPTVRGNHGARLSVPGSSASRHDRLAARLSAPRRQSVFFR